MLLFHRTVKFVLNLNTLVTKNIYTINIYQKVTLCTVLNGG